MLVAGRTLLLFEYEPLRVAFLRLLCRLSSVYVRLLVEQGDDFVEASLLLHLRVCIERYVRGGPPSEVGERLVVEQNFDYPY